MAFIVMAVYQLVMHELAHVAAQVCLGGTIKKVGINWKGPYIVRSALPSRWKNISVALAGPLMNIALWLILSQVNTPYASLGMWLGVINLIPVLPNSDGWCIMHYYKGDYSIGKS